MRQIILEPGKPPQFIGEWTIGDVLEMARILILWVKSLAINVPEEKQDK